MNIIAQIPKNKRETLQIDLSEYRGHQLLGLRLWIPNDEGDGLKPTSKGITIAVALLPAIRDALAKAEEEARRVGWMGGSDA